MSKQLPSEDEALRLLRESGCSPEVIRHCIAVMKLATEIAQAYIRKGFKINLKLLRVGALLHDIGRSKTHTVHHAVVGAKIAESLGLPRSVISIIERHVGGGITVEEAKELGWPEKNYIPQTLEEKIVAYADKLIDGSKRVPINHTLDRLRRELGADHPAIRRVENLHLEVSSVLKSRLL